MRVPIRWLNDYVKVDDIQISELADLFLGIGFEVEEIINPSHSYKNIVTGRILNIDKHQDADNLYVLSVDIGSSNKTIVTGAKNISKDDMVPVALAGSVVSGGKAITNANFKGVLSEGMLCSGKELDIDDNTIEGAEVDGILILPKNTQVGVEIGKVLDVDEYIFDISINSNRPDCNSILGLAKEIAVKLKRKVEMPDISYKTNPVSSDMRLPNIEIENYKLCSRYFANVITDVKIQKSPRFIRKRLLAANVRPINNVVDITNFVLLEMGQPLHAFDFSKVSGKINVRTAKENEKIVALNDIEYNLEKDMLVIADNVGPLAIAGVMGGKTSAICTFTKEVLLEAARFAKTTVRYTSRAVGLRSDSSGRFERGVDYLSVDMGRQRALNLFDTLGVGKILDQTMVDELPRPSKKIINTSFEQINSILGIDVPSNEIKRILEALDFEVKINAKSNQIECLVPLNREDVDCFADLSEEVIRFCGYEKILSTNMETASLTRGSVPLFISNIRKIKNILCGAGLYEIINFSFIAAGDCEKLNLESDDLLTRQLKIINPLGEDRAYMRTQLVSSMIKTLQLNKNRQNDNFGLFEISRVFISDEIPPKTLPKEPYTLCIGLIGSRFDFYYLKNIVTNLFTAFSLPLEIIKSSKGYLHTGISADIVMEGKVVGSFGKLHPLVAKNFETSSDIFILEISLEDIISKPIYIAKVASLPKFPAVDRDLAIVVKKEITAGEVVKVIKEASGGCLEKTNLFDIYQGGQIEEGYKSMAFSIRFRSHEKTLLDVETQNLMSNIISNLESKFGAKLR